jgi:hypothetical protein
VRHRPLQRTLFARGTTAAVLVAAAAAVGCQLSGEGLDVDGDAMPTGVTSQEGGVGEDGAAGGTGACTGTCAIAVPPGWSLVAYAGTRDSECPAGLATTDLLEGPTATPAACSCDCQPATPSTCDKNLSWNLDNNSDSAACNFSGPGTFDTSGGCHPFGAQLPNHLQIAQPKVTAPGTCLMNKHVDPTAMNAVPVRVCTALSCPYDACSHDLPSAFHLCIRAPGDIACPAMMKKHLLGTGINLACSDCQCTFVGWCSGKIHFYADPNCHNNEVLTTSASGHCQDGRDGTMSGGYEYEGSTSDSCTATSQPMSSPLGPTTICCP